MPPPIPPPPPPGGPPPIPPRPRPPPSPRPSGSGELGGFDPEPDCRARAGLHAVGLRLGDDKRHAEFVDEHALGHARGDVEANRPGVGELEAPLVVLGGAEHFDAGNRTNRGAAGASRPALGRVLLALLARLGRRSRLVRRRPSSRAAAAHPASPGKSRRHGDAERLLVLARGVHPHGEPGRAEHHARGLITGRQCDIHELAVVPHAERQRRRTQRDQRRRPLRQLAVDGWRLRAPHALDAESFGRNRDRDRAARTARPVRAQHQPAQAPQARTFQRRRRGS